MDNGQARARQGPQRRLWGLSLAKGLRTAQAGAAFGPGAARLAFQAIGAGLGNVVVAVGAQDPARLRAVAVKGLGLHVRQALAGKIDRFLAIDGDGATNPDVRRLGHSAHVRRPVWPLDDAAAVAAVHGLTLDPASQVSKTDEVRPFAPSWGCRHHKTGADFQSGKSRRGPLLQPEMS